VDVVRFAHEVEAAMDNFSYLSVLISIVLGLGIT